MKTNLPPLKHDEQKSNTVRSIERHLLLSTQSRTTRPHHPGPGFGRESRGLTALMSRRRFSSQGLRVRYYSVALSWAVNRFTLLIDSFGRLGEQNARPAEAAQTKTTEGP